MADICQAEGLIDGFSFDNLLADKGYDSDRFRASIADAGAQAVIPSNRSRSQAIPYDKDLYKERNLVERFITKSSITAALLHAMRKPSCRSRRCYSWSQP